jgi:hypothetical protein
MGAWNFKALESDNGLDVIDFIKEYVSSKYPALESVELNLWDLIVAMKEDGLLGESFEDVDFLFDNSAMALTELYFMFMDHGVIDYESEDDNLNLKKRIKSLNVNSDALEFIHHCLSDIKEGKPDMDGEEREILEIWEDSPEWKEHLNSLIVRLNNEIAKKSNS